MIDILKKICTDFVLAAVYTNRMDYEKFSVGYVLSVTEENILFSHLNARGEFDGYSVRKTSSIFRVETDGLYIDKMMKLSTLKKDSGIQFPIIHLEGDILIDAIYYAINNKLIAAISIDEDASDIVGYIIDLIGDNVKILQVSEYGLNDGETIFPIQEISRICVNDTECMDLKSLYQINMKK